MQVDGTKENTKLTLPKKRKMPWNKISQDGAQKEKMDYYTGVTFTSNKGGIYCNLKLENAYIKTREKNLIFFKVRIRPFMLDPLGRRTTLVYCQHAKIALETLYRDSSLGQIPTKIWDSILASQAVWST